MKCPKCGAILEADSVFCVSCGASLSEIGEAASSTPGSTEHDNDVTPQKQGEHPQKESVSNKGKIISLIVGTIIIAIGIVRIMSAGTSISSTSFGGDFYTYTYQGLVAVSEILASIEVSLGWIIVAIGAAIDANALRHWGDFR